MTTLELLAPARDLECGMAAIDHGADAVYVGAPRFGARAAAGVSIEDIEKLCLYAHRFRAKVYVTVNTIVYDDELQEVERMVDLLACAGVDAILVQDMAVLQMVKRVGEKHGKALEAHASTQTDNRTPEKVDALRRMGFKRVVLARELSLQQMSDIHQAVPEVELEAFVHGALCVSFSGLCYASQHCFQRSANRGECAQFCRLKFDLVDADGKTVDKPRHWLSLRDLCRIHDLGRMADAGITSFKIEGRLKGPAYVKNVVAAYSRELDKVVRASGGKYRRRALGNVQLEFTPNLKKTFNRGYTTYFLDGDANDIASPDTPKAMGEMVGRVKELRRDSFNVAGTATFANGDGLCFFDQQRQLQGFRVNRVEGNRIFPQQMPRELRPGMVLYRNADAAMERMLAKNSASRRIPLRVNLHATPTGVRLDLHVPQTDIGVGVEMAVEPQEARMSQEENMQKQLSRMGGTVYVAEQVTVDEEAAHRFVPSSMLATLRRNALEAMDKKIMEEEGKEELSGNTDNSPDEMRSAFSGKSLYPREYAAYPYLYNVANQQARDLYAEWGMTQAGQAFELGGGGSQPLIMQCRHCIRRLLGCCTRQTHRRAPWREPLTLVLPDRRRFVLQFDCQQCQMNVYAEK